MEHKDIQSLAAAQRAIADPTRILIMRLLLERELCVCEIVQALEAPQYKISRHLSVLKQAGLVRDWREGTWMHYEVNPGLAPEWRGALDRLRYAWDKSRDVQAALLRLRKSAKRAPGVSAVCAE